MQQQELDLGGEWREAGLIRLCFPVVVALEVRPVKPAAIVGTRQILPELVRAWERGSQCPLAVTGSHQRQPVSRKEV
jgi:hypothetical protein